MSASKRRTKFELRGRCSCMVRVPATQACTSVHHQTIRQSGLRYPTQHLSFSTRQPAIPLDLAISHCGYHIFRSNSGQVICFCATASFPASSRLLVFILLWTSFVKHSFKSYLSRGTRLRMWQVDAAAVAHVLFIAVVTVCAVLLTLHFNTRTNSRYFKLLDGLHDACILRFLCTALPPPFLCPFHTCINECGLRHVSSLNPMLYRRSLPPAGVHTRSLPRKIILIRHAESQGNVDATEYAKTPDSEVPLVRLHCSTWDVTGIDIDAGVVSAGTPDPPINYTH